MAIRTRVSLPIRSNISAEIVSFRFKNHDAEDVAILFPGWENQQSVLTRIHSECLTGDVFSSRRCDCGAQLDEAITRMSESDGILLYLRQEGRGIGLYNKLEAYALQSEKGQDTFEANLHLGFPADGRDYGIAARMLEDLSVKSVRLLTNNRMKARALECAGIEVSEIIPTCTHVTDENLTYLEAKRDHGHAFARLLKKRG